ncbi:MAG: hypothetical protein J0H54_13775, partial [Rhizobiales bacterium]|nr:hypothetical protein [Hyphomicrobiales bacterium]
MNRAAIGDWPSIRRLILLAALCLATLAGSAAFAQDARQAQLDSWNATLSRIDTAIRQLHTTDAELRRFSDQVADVMADASALAAQLAPDVAAANAQVKALSPVAGADQQISEDVKNQLAAAQEVQGNVVGTQQRAIAIVAHGTATQTQINDRRRSIFTAR